MLSSKWQGLLGTPEPCSRGVGCKDGKSPGDLDLGCLGLRKDGQGTACGHRAVGEAVEGWGRRVGKASLRRDEAEAGRGVGTEIYPLEQCGQAA